MSSLPSSGCLLPHEHPQQRRLAGAVGADDAHDPARRQAEVHVLEDHAVAVRLAEVDRLDHPLAQPLARRDLDFQLLRPVLELLGRHLFVGRHAGLALGLPGLGRRCEPTPARGPACAAGPTPASLRARAACASARATTSSCPPTECPCRGRAPESSSRRCRESSDRASPRRSCPRNPSDAARATRRSRRRDGWSARPAAAGRASPAESCTAPRAASRRRRAW